MDFGLSDDQRLLQETVSRFVADRYALDQRKGYLANAAGHDPAVAAELDELGLSLVQVPEDLGGLGGDAFDALVVGEALGPGLVLEPVLDAMTAVCALGQGVPDVVEAASAHTLALFERGQRHSLKPVGCRVDGKGLLSGEKTLVANVAGLTHALVSALDEAGAVGLHRVALDDDGVTRFDYPLQDGRPFADLRLEAVPASRIEGIGLAEIEAANARRVIAECAMAVGVMQAAADMTREYLSVRKQFGRPLAAFQALQFRLVD
ncbi:MAG: acyl-CoA dehydrogenase family protein, partial [Pseudomonadota bacterium]|nr:acyl-CoA dehydrogenase family protein [Pseudomonadota bacterium]